MKIEQLLMMQLIHDVYFIENDVLIGRVLKVNELCHKIFSRTLFNNPMYNTKCSSKLVYKNKVLTYTYDEKMYS